MNTLRIDDSAADDPDGAQLRPCALEVPNPVIVAEVLSSTTPHVGVPLGADPHGRGLLGGLRLPLTRPTG
jgi:hypothetical protein